MHAAYTFTGDGIGTRWQIDILDQIQKLHAHDVWKKIQLTIEDYDQVYSRFRKDSFITHISQTSGEYHFPKSSLSLFSLYQQLYNLTNGLFTPLIAQTLVEAGYDAGYSLKKKSTMSQPPRWEDVIEYKDCVLRCKKPVLLDFGAGGKGQLIDIVAQILEENGIQNATVDASGDIRHMSATGKKIRIGLEHPEKLSQIIGVVELDNESICASSGSRRKWGEYHHIIRPDTLQSPKDIIATWVTAQDTLLADSIATCLFFVQADKLKSAGAFEYLVLKSDYRIEKSSGFRVQLFLDKRQA